MQQINSIQQADSSCLEKNQQRSAKICNNPWEKFQNQKDTMHDDLPRAIKALQAIHVKIEFHDMYGMLCNMTCCMQAVVTEMAWHDVMQVSSKSLNGVAWWHDVMHAVMNEMLWHDEEMPWSWCVRKSNPPSHFPIHPVHVPHLFPWSIKIDVQVHVSKCAKCNSKCTYVSHVSLLSM